MTSNLPSVILYTVRKIKEDLKMFGYDEWEALEDQFLAELEEDLEDWDDEPSDWDLEIGFDPYIGCYSWDC